MLVLIETVHGIGRFVSSCLIINNLYVFVYLPYCVAIKFFLSVDMLNLYSATYVKVISIEMFAVKSFSRVENLLRTLTYVGEYGLDY